jgi:hypothetical protein
MGATPQRRSIASETRSLAPAATNVTGYRLKITLPTARQNLQGLRPHDRTGQDARRTAEADRVHDVCPPLPADRE